MYFDWENTQLQVSRTNFDLFIMFILLRACGVDEDLRLVVINIYIYIENNKRN